MLLLIRRLACRQRDNLYRRQFFSFLIFLLPPHFPPYLLLCSSLAQSLLGHFFPSIVFGWGKWLCCWVRYIILFGIWAFNLVVVSFFFSFSPPPCFMFIALHCSLSLLKSVVSQIYPSSSLPSLPLAVSFFLKKTQKLPHLRNYLSRNCCLSQCST